MEFETDTDERAGGSQGSRVSTALTKVSIISCRELIRLLSFPCEKVKDRGLTINMISSFVESPVMSQKWDALKLNLTK